MPSVRRIHVTVVIHAPAAVVWRHVTSPESYNRWASAFAEGSHVQGTWEQGSKMRFLAPNGDGMVAEIAERRECAFLSIRHLGVIADGVEDTASEAVKAWAPAYENYTFVAVPEGTAMIVDQDAPAAWEEFLSRSWPAALALLKDLAESTASAS